MTQPWYVDDSVTVHHGDCLNVMRDMPDNSVDAVITDPPYSLSFMNSKWDSHASPAAFQTWCTAWALEAHRVLKPGGHMLAFGGTRTSHRLTSGIEDAGFEIRDSIGSASAVIAWIYASGFPKSLNVSADKRFCHCLPGMPDAATEEATESATKVLFPEVHGDRTHDLADLTDVHGVSVGICSNHPVPGSAEQDVLAGMCMDLAVESNGGATVEPRPTSHGSVRSMQQDDQAITARDGTQHAHLLLTKLPREGAHRDSANERLRPDRQAGSAAVRSDQPGMEGRGDVQASEGQLHRTSVRTVSTGSDGDGQVGWLHHGAPTSDGAVGGPPINSDGMREPQRPEPEEQRQVKPGDVSDQRGSQAGRGRPLCPGCGKPRVASGLGTALKPAWEPIVVARKPVSESTIAGNVLKHGTGALNIDASRVGSGGQLKWETPRDMGYHSGTDNGQVAATESTLGRWPANVVLTHTQSEDGGDACEDECVPGCPIAELDQQSGTMRARGNVTRDRAAGMGYHGGALGYESDSVDPGDTGGASRFFPTFRYQAKAPASERPSYTQDGAAPAEMDYGGYKVAACDSCGTRFPAVQGQKCGHDGWSWVAKNATPGPGRISHPTVKPLGLMRFLCTLITPPGGVVLDPFAGSGATLEAALMDGFHAIGIEQSEEYLPLLRQRIDRARQPQPAGKPAAKKRPNDPRDPAAASLHIQDDLFGGAA